MFTLPVFNTQGQEIENIQLDSAVFDGIVNTAAIYQVINAYRANQRKGLASTKTMGEVSGGGRKPWKQKGTGRARVGSIRSPLWRHGGVIFGPHPRGYSYNVPKKIRALALKSALCAKLKENDFIILDALDFENPKTKEAAKIFSNLKITPAQRVLLLLDKIDTNAKLSLRNLSFLSVTPAANANTYEVMASNKVVVTKKGLDALTGRFKQ